MKISLRWLNEYVDVRDYLAKPDELAKILTGAGLEVESIEDRARDYQNVVVGEIIELGKHPNADKLTLCQVNVGEGRPRQIVCGAKNHKQGDKVVVALPGAILPGNFAIQFSKIRDVESHGMLCSEKELALKTESEGILILPKDAKVGQSFAAYSGREDVVLDINVTPNRADCLSHIGLAREVSCLLDRSLKLPDVSVKTSSLKTKDRIDVKLRDKELCPRYAGRIVAGIQVGPSPSWLVERLRSVGVNSINNVVDVTNFVMMEYGQPLHAFDTSEIRGGEIIIEKSVKDENFKTFDGTLLTLTGEELTIRDQERAVALAGVIGGVNSGVSEKTTEVFIEAAHFSAKGVRRTSRRLGIDTDSGYRFSRGTDPENVVEAMNRAAHLLQELTNGEVAKDFIDVYPNPATREAIKVRKKTLEERLGYEVDLSDFAKWMKRLHCRTKVSGDTVTVTTPSFRVDLEIEMDLVEEYARLNGYDKIPETFPVLAQQPSAHAESYVREEKLAELVVHEGFQEARNYSFLRGDWQAQLMPTSSLASVGLTNSAVVKVRNPLSDETSVMRQSLLPGLLTNLRHNYHHGSLDGRLFEIGNVFGVESGVDARNYFEGKRLAFVAWGQPAHLWQKSENAVVYNVKSAIEGVLSRLRGAGQWRQLEKGEWPPLVHPGQASLLFFEGKTVGFVGTLHPLLRDEWKIRHDVAVAELDVAAIMRGYPRPIKSKSVSKFPAVERDLALVMPLNLAAADVLAEIRKSAGPLLQRVDVFDVYRGQGVAEGMQSIAVRLRLQDLESTLSEERVTEVVQRVLGALATKYSIKTR